MPAENAGRAFALVLVDQLVREGMQHAVVAPGSRSTPIALALLEHPDVTVHVRIDERSAAYLALGLAKVSQRIVAVLCTSGTATSYFHGAVMEADLSSVPLVVLTADRPPELHGIGANQTVAQQGLYGDAVRFSPEVPVPVSAPGSVTRWRALVATAARHAHGLTGGSPGPVHLNLPLRDPLTPVDDGVGFPYDLNVPYDAATPAVTDSEALPHLAARLRGIGRGVIVAGGWATGSVDAVLDYAVRAGWPIIAEPHSNARVGAMALWATDVVLRDAEFTIRHTPEIVLVVGRVGLSRTLLAWLETVPHVVLSPDGHHWDVTRNAAVVATGPPTVLATIETGAPDPSWASDWLVAATAAGNAIDHTIDRTGDVAADSAGELNEPRVAREVAALLPDGAALVVSSSMPVRDLDLVMRPRDGITVHANRGVSGIDGFVSTAMGIALGRADEGPTVALCGDLSLLHDVNGLMTGDEPRPDLAIVVINNDGGGIFSLLPQGSAVEPAAFERLFGTPHGVDIANVAATYDVPHSLVSSSAELAAALCGPGGLRIIEVKTDRADNTALHAQLRDVSVSTA
jgi:2-succinyl-5-enolpyruvyl-6-hydroxy-3-cyclohexene-1-carboxylate synthase